jgi:predicted RNA-binding Zn ribbon-like protein
MAITGIRRLEELLLIANTLHQPEARQEGEGHGTDWLPAHDHLETPEEAARYLRRQGIRVSDPLERRQVAALKQIRDAVQAFPESRRRYERATATLLEPARFRLNPDAHIISTRDGWDGFIDGLLIPLLELPEQADRLKRCENDQCGWLFLDHSKNRSRQWCESGSCGNRQRVRRFRHRLEEAS